MSIILIWVMLIMWISPWFYIGVVAYCDRTDAQIGSGNEDRPKQAFTDGKSDRRAIAASFELRGLHAESLVGVGIKSARWN
jgi:hypothetical protein